MSTEEIPTAPLHPVIACADIGRFIDVILKEMERQEWPILEGEEGFTLLGMSEFLKLHGSHPQLQGFRSFFVSAVPTIAITCAAEDVYLLDLARSVERFVEDEGISSLDTYIWLEIFEENYEARSWEERVSAREFIFSLTKYHLILISTHVFRTCSCLLDICARHSAGKESQPVIIDHPSVDASAVFFDQNHDFYHSMRDTCLQHLTKSRDRMREQFETVELLNQFIYAFVFNIYSQILDGSTYQGALRDGKRHGRGLQSFSNGYKYDGVFRDGIFYCGVAETPSGSVYSLETLGKHLKSVRCGVILSDDSIATGGARGLLRVWEQKMSSHPKTLSGHTSKVKCMLALPNQGLVSGSAAGELFVWDVSSKECMHKLRGHAKEITCLMLVSGTTFLSCCQEGILFLWDLASNPPSRVEKHHNSWVSCSALLPNGHIVTGSCAWNLKIWDFSDGCAHDDCLFTLTGHVRHILAVMVTRAGDIVSGSSDSTVRVWEAEKAACKHVLRGHFKGIRFLLELPQDDHIATGSIDGAISIWRVSSGECIRTMGGYTADLKCMALWSGGRIVAGSLDGSLTVWDSSSGRSEDRIVAHQSIVTFLATTPDGGIVTGGGDTFVKLWHECAPGEADAQMLLLLDRHSESAAPPSPVSNRDTLATPSVNGLSNTLLLRGHKDFINCVEMSRDGDLLISGCADSTIKVWDLSSGECNRTLRGHSDKVTSILSLSDNELLTGSEDCTIRRWDLFSGKELCLYSAHNNTITSLAKSPDSDYFLSGSADGKLGVWRVSSEDCLRFLGGHSDEVVEVLLLANTVAVSSSRDWSLRVWDILAGRCLRLLNGHSARVTGLISHASGNVISSGAEGVLRVWNLVTGKCSLKLTGHDGGVSCMCLVDDSRLVSGSYDKSLKLWSLFKGECLLTFVGHTSYVACVALLSGERIISGSWDRTLKIWDLSTGLCLQTLTGHLDRVWCIAASPHGKIVSAGGLETILRVWSCSKGEDRYQPKLQ